MSRPCDAVILDLEDGTHPSLREEARAKLPDSIARVKSAGKTAAVRINGDLLTAVTDLRAAVRPGLDILVLPKVEHARDVQLIGTAVRALETEAGIAPGHVRFLLQIESAAALPRLHDIASADPRVMGMMLGSEDFSLDCGGLPTADALLTPSLMVLYAARAAGVQPIGFVGSIADLGSPEAFQGVVERARALGFRGAVVVHPKFLDVVNACYTPSDEQVAAARKVVEAFEAADAQGLGAIKLDGIMIDKPVYRRALELLADAS
jgi:citrate lyase subunit beta/citryl-CoA lyase